MKKYKWNDASLRKKSQLYGRLSLGFGIAALVVWLFLRESSTWWLAGLFICVVVCYVLSERVLSKDKQLKPKEK